LRDGFKKSGRFPELQAHFLAQPAQQRAIKKLGLFVLRGVAFRGPKKMKVLAPCNKNHSSQSMWLNRRLSVDWPLFWPNNPPARASFCVMGLKNQGVFMNYAPVF
jgi:hypothetical protein